MFTENIRNFIETGDFATVMDFIKTTDPADMLMMPFIYIPLGITLLCLAHPKTTQMGQKMLVWFPALGWLGVTAVVLKNDEITNTGPFLLGLVSFFIIVGWLIYSQLMAND